MRYQIEYCQPVIIHLKKRISQKRYQLGANWIKLRMHIAAFTHFVMLFSLANRQKC